jgi:hypothetical protein
MIALNSPLINGTIGGLKEQQGKGTSNVALQKSAGWGQIRIQHVMKRPESDDILIVMGHRGDSATRSYSASVVRVGSRREPCSNQLNSDC